MIVTLRSVVNVMVTSLIGCAGAAQHPSTWGEAMLMVDVRASSGGTVRSSTTTGSGAMEGAEIGGAGTGGAEGGAMRAQEPGMRVRVMGEGPRLVLVGGGLTGWKSWEPHAERLSGTRTVALLQLLSVQHGLEDRPLPRGYSVKLESRALTAALDGLGWSEPLDLAAWSYGAVITLDFALDHPERVRTLTLIEPPGIWVLPDRGGADPDVAALVRLAETMPEDVGESQLEQFVCSVGLCPPDVEPRQLPQWPLWMEHRRSLRSGSSPFDHADDAGRLRSFDRPVLLVTGTGTAPFLRRIHETLGTQLPRARTVEMPAGHAPHLVSQDQFLAELDRFQMRGE